MIGRGGVRGRDAWGEAQRRDAEAVSGQECACQRSGDLWDVRGAGTLRWRIPLPSGASWGPLPSVFPVVVQNPKKAYLGFGWKEFSGIPSTGGGKKVPGPDSPPIFSLPTPSSRLKEQKTEGRSCLAAGKPVDLFSFTSLNPTVRETDHFVPFLEPS